MDAPPSSPESASPAPPRRRLIAFRFALAVLLLTLSLFALLIIQFTKPAEKVIWLNPKTAFRPALPASLKRLKDKLVSLPVIAPFWQRHHPKQPLILVSAQVFNCSDPAPSLRAMGAPIATNANGMRAWIVSRGVDGRMKLPMVTFPEFTLLSTSNIFSSLRKLPGLSDGTESSSFIFTFATTALPETIESRSSTQSPSASEWTPANSRPIQLTIRLTKREPVQMPGQGDSIFKTNFDSTWQAIIPNLGCLVVDCGNTTATNSEHYWLVANAQILNLQAGKPIVLPASESLVR